MELAGMNITYQHYPFTYFLDSMQRLGITKIELWAGEPHLFVYRNLLSNLRAIRKEIVNRDLEVVCLTPEQCVYPYNLAASDNDWREKSIEYFKENLYVAAELETKMMLVTSGIGDFSVDNQTSWKYTVDSIARLAEIAETEGISLVFEPLTGMETNLVTNCHELKKIIDEIDSPVIKPMVDTVAMRIAGETPEDYFETFNGDIPHFHLVDGDGHSDQHLALGDGVLPICDYLNSLKENSYSGVCTLEVIGYEYYRDPESAIRKSIEILQKNNTKDFA